MDSGATCHIVAKRCLQCFEVVAEYPNVRCDLRAANDESIETFGVVDLKVRFTVKEGDRVKPRLHVLTKCVVADIPFCVMSPVVLVTHGWQCVLASGELSYLERDDCRVPLRLEDRAWWADSKLKSRGRRSSGGPRPMEVEEGKALRDRACDLESGELVELGSKSSSIGQEFGRLSFLLRAVRAVVVEEPNRGEAVRSQSEAGEVLAVMAQEPRIPVRVRDGLSLVEVVDQGAVGQSKEFLRVGGGSDAGALAGDGSVAAEGGDSGVAVGGDVEMEDHPIPDELGREELEREAPTGDAELGETDVPHSVYEHLAAGHNPYLATCRQCAKSRGKVPHARGAYSVNADFAWLDKVKFIVLVVACTNMVASFVLTDNVEKNARELNGWLREVGLTGKSMDLTIDGEGHLRHLFQRAMNVGTSPLTGMNFIPIPPDRHQANGIAERMVSAIKELVCTHLLFLEERLGIRIPFESPIVNHVVRYSARSRNIHHVPTGSGSTAVARMRGRENAPKPKTFPFGCLVLAKPTETSRRDGGTGTLEKLVEVVHLGPFSSAGGGFWGMWSADSRVGSNEELGNKIRRFQNGRVVSPCQWTWRDLKPLLTGAIESDHQLPPEPGVGPVYDDSEAIDPGEDQRFSAPRSGPPVGWIRTHGPTPGCYACSQIAKDGKSHGRVHGRDCKSRYTHWLEAQSPELPQVVPPADVPAAPVPLPIPVVVPVAVPPEGGGGFGDDANIPMDIVEDDQPVGEPQPDGVPMEMDSLVSEYQEQLEDRFLALEQSSSGGRWIEVDLCGQVVKQQIGNGLRCETSGVLLDPIEAEKGFRKEYEQLGKLKVGKVVSETVAHSKSEKAKQRIVGARWVLTKKPDRVRARVVCKDFRAEGLSSLREGLYAPTSSIEALRFFLALIHVVKGALFSVDISTAFLYASLEGQTQVICMPSSCRTTSGDKVYFDLFKALYGLRRAPLYWFRTLKNFLVSIGFEETAEPALLRKRVEGFIIAVIIYVDDLLIGGPLKFCREIIQQMCQRFETKLTGEIHAGACGELEFLGRKIVRREKMGGFFLGLPGSYFDKIEQTSGLSLKVASVAPEMAKFVEEKESAVLLAKAEAEKYRSVLGQLSWFSLSVPLLLYYTSWLGCFQQNPSEMAWAGMRAVLRFAKGFRGFYQEIPVGSFDYGTEKLTAVIDASWNTKSVAGGFILWGSAMIKAWSRRISTTCLSSAEAELHALVEGLRELLGTSTVVETCLKGLPERDQSGWPKQDTGSMKLVILTDSDSARCISKMAGLLRKVRHMELRVAILQEYVQSGRLEVIFVPGRANASDVLTKPPDAQHLPLFLRIWFKAGGAPG